MNSDKEIIRRLDAIIGLLLDLVESSSPDKKPESQRIARLKQLGLENTEIGIMFGRSGAEIAKLAYEVKRKKK